MRNRFTTYSNANAKTPRRQDAEKIQLKFYLFSPSLRVLAFVLDLAQREFSRIEKDALHVPVEHVFGDVFGDDRFKFFQRIRVSFAHLCGDFETDMQ